MAERKRYEITVAPKATYLADQSDRAKNQYVFAYTITITNTGDVAGAARQPPLDHHRRRHRVQEVRGLGVVGQQPVLEARRELRVHERRDHPDAGGHDARQLPDGRRGRHDVRGADPAVHAVRAAHAALSSPSRATPRFRRGLASTRAAASPRAIVHHTMPTAITSATSASRKIHPIAPPPPSRRAVTSHCVARSRACARRPARRPRRPDARAAAAPPPAPAPPAPPPRAGVHARGLVATLPGWAAMTVAGRVARVPASAAARCRRGRDDARHSGSAPCADAAACRRPRRAQRCAHSSRPSFARTASPPPTAATPGSSPATTSRCSRARATRTARFTVPLYAAPDDLLTVDLAALYPELKDKRVRGRVEGKRVVPYWPRADIERGTAPLAARRSRTSPIRSTRSSSDPGLGPHRARRRHA